MKARALLLVAGASLLGSALLCSRAAASDEDREAYDHAIAQALDHYRTHDWAGARAAFERAHALSPNARTWRGLAMSAYYAHDYVAAAEAFEHALSEPERPLSSEQRAQARDLLDRVYQQIAQVRVSVSPSAATVEIDQNVVHSEQRLPMAPGRCHIAAKLAGYVTQVEDVELAPGQTLDLRFELAKEPSASATAPAPAPPPPILPARALSAQPSPARATAPQPDHLPAWITAGATLAAAIAATSFALVAQDELGNLQQQCHELGCTPEHRSALWRDSPIETYETATNVALAVTAAGAVTTVVLFVLPHSSEPSPPVTPDRLALGLRVAGQW